MGRAGGSSVRRRWVRTAFAIVTMSIAVSGVASTTFAASAGSGSQSNVATPITAVGTLANKAGTDTTTLAVSPQHVGDLLVLVVKVASATVAASRCSGGGVGTWSRAESPYAGFTGHDLEIWTGSVTTAGASTVTAAFSSSRDRRLHGTGRPGVLGLVGRRRRLGHRQRGRHLERLVDHRHLPEAHPDRDR